MPGRTERRQTCKGERVLCFWQLRQLRPSHNAIDTCLSHVVLQIYVYVYIYIYIYRERERESNLPIGLDLGLTWFMHASHQAGQYLLCGSFFVSLGPSPLLVGSLDFFIYTISKRGILYVGRSLEKHALRYLCIMHSKQFLGNSPARCQDEPKGGKPAKESGPCVFGSLGN